MIAAGRVALAAALALTLAALYHQTTRPSADFATRYAAGVATAHGVDPYDGPRLVAIERRYVGAGYDYVFQDPPPTAWGFRAIAALPYHAAVRFWRAVLLASALACTLLALRITGGGLRGALGWTMIATVALDFGPFRDSISALQIDPFVATLALLGFVVARRPAGGVLAALSTMKPQTALFGAAGGVAAGRLQFVIGLVAGWIALILATVLAAGPSWRSWYDHVHRSPSHHGALAVAGAVLLGLAALAATVRVARGRDPVIVLAAAACLNAIVTPRVFMNAQSNVLVLVALLVCVRRGRPSVPLGAAAGVFAVSGLFAVSFHSGYGHAAYPIVVAGLLAAFVATEFPRWRLAALAAFATNVAVTLPSTPERAHNWYASAAAAVLLVLLAQSGSATTFGADHGSA